MKIQVSQTELLRAAMIASVPAATHSTLPILNNVLISTTDSGVEFRAGGFGLRAIVPMRATVIQTGAVTVPARILADLVKSLPNGEVVLEQSGTSVTVTAGKSTAKLATMPVKDFPAWPEIPAQTVATIPADVFRRIVESVVPAAPLNDPRKVLCSVSLELSPERITAVATNGKVLSKLETAAVTGVDKEVALTVPVQLLTQAAKLLDSGPVVLTTDGLQIALDINGVRLIENAVEGRYPDYRRVIPGDFAISLGFKRDDMLETVKRVSIMANRESCPIDLNFADDGCHVSTEDADRGQINDFAEAHGSALFDVCMNYKFFIQALSSIDGNEVEMSANQTTTPVIIRGENDSDLTLLIMPIKKVEQPREDEEARDER